MLHPDENAGVLMTSAFLVMCKRIGWLLLLFLTETLTGVDATGLFIYFTMAGIILSL